MMKYQKNHQLLYLNVKLYFIYEKILFLLNIMCSDEFSFAKLAVADEQNYGRKLECEW